MLNRIQRALYSYIEKHDHPPAAIYVTRTCYASLNAEMWEMLSTQPSENMIGELFGVPVIILRDDDFVLGG